MNINNNLFEICSYLSIKSIIQFKSTNIYLHSTLNNNILWKYLYKLYFPTHKITFINKTIFIDKYIFTQQNVLSVIQQDILYTIHNNTWAMKLYYNNFITTHNHKDTYISDTIYSIMSDMHRVSKLRILKSTHAKYMDKDNVYFDMMHGINMLIDELLDITCHEKWLIYTHLKHNIKNIDKYNMHYYF
jgi:hypothetical protein